MLDNEMEDVPFEELSEEDLQVLDAVRDFEDEGGYMSRSDIEFMKSPVGSRLHVQGCIRPDDHVGLCEVASEPW